jgi:hypothetical protein
MKINEILVESQLQEGPMLDKFGKAVGGVASGVAKGVGAVAGGIAGMGSAFKKGFNAGKTTVAGDDEAPAKPSMIGDLAKGLGKDAYKGATGYDLPGQDKASLKKKAAQGGAEPAAAPAAAPAATPAAAPGAAPAAAPGAAPAAAPGAAPAAGAAAPAAPAAKAAKAAAPNPKADTAYAQAQKAIAGLQPEQKKEIVTMLQADPKVKAAMTAKPAAKPAAPAAKTAKPAAPADAGSGAMGAMASQLTKGGAAEPNTMANAPVSKTNKAKPGNPNAAPAPGMTADGQPHWDPATGKGAKYDGVTGEMTPAWKAEQDKKAAEKQTKTAPAQQDKAPATPTTGQAATQAADAGSNPEQAALDAMKAKNPKLAGMMAQAGMDDQGNDVAPAKKRGGRKAKPAAQTQAEIDADRERIMGVTSDSIVRRQPMMAESFSLFRKR